jgi:DNA-directed RNA polymerase subunit RPC12/RpoP
VSESPYRASPPAEVDAYLLAWADLRKRRIRMWIAFLSWVPVGGGLSVLAERLLPFNLGLLVALPLMTLVVGLSIHAALFRCPRCGERFQVGRSLKDPKGRRCMNCGIRIGTSKSTDQDDEEAARGVY